MVSSFKFRPYIFICIVLTILFGISLIAQEKNSFEDGTYSRYTQSIIEDGDFNLINQTKDQSQNWLSTQTGNHPNYEHPAVSVYLFPFLLYQKAINYLIGDGNVKSFIPSHILATLFYLLLSLILLSRIMQGLEINHKKSAIAIFALSTPFLWFTFFASTSSNIFSLAYSIFLFGWYYLTNDKKEEKNWRVYFFLGLACALGIAIRIQQVWSLSLLFLLLSFDDKRSIKKISFFFLGATIPAVCFICNLYMRNMQFLHPHRIYGTLSFDFIKSTLSYALIGPNGYFTLTPIYLIILISGLWLIFKSHKNRKLLFCILSIPTALFLYYSSQWPLMDSLAGRHQLDYFFIYVLIIGLAFDHTNKYKNKAPYIILWALLLICILWNIRTHIAFYYVDNTNWHDWQFIYFVKLNYLWEQISGIPNIVNDLRVLNVLPQFIPLVFVLAYVIYRFWMTNLKGTLLFCRNIIIFGAAFYIIFTQLNIFNNPRNVSKYIEAGLYRNKVITSGDAATFYDDFIETYHKGLRWYVSRKECIIIGKLKRIKDQFIKEVESEIVYDPLNFKDGLRQGKLRKSYLEGQDVALIYKQVREICHF